MIEHPIVKVHRLSMRYFSWRKRLEFIDLSNKSCDIVEKNKNKNPQLKLFVIVSSFPVQKRVLPRLVLGTLNKGDQSAL